MGHFGSFLGHFGNFGSFLGQFGQFWVIFGLFWVILGHFWPFFGANFFVAKYCSVLFISLFATLIFITIIIGKTQRIIYNVQFLTIFSWHSTHHWLGTPIYYIIATWEVEWYKIVLQIFFYSWREIFLNNEQYIT